MTFKTEPKFDKLSDIVHLCIKKLDDKKSVNTVLMNVSELNPYFEYFIIALGSSQIHCKAMAKELLKYLDSVNLKGRNKPDFNSGWIVLDYNDLVIHIFTEEMNDHYQLEKLWSDAEYINTPGKHK